ncbi:hypothetical protein BDF20DRAFT_898309 [Mycotypha africana]|uniref:uncharacterized protein n=1 Tax=Mycotypha africana TaxID=64632 RepID=UPI0022FFF0AF|nr:uncharacterized protein BDF20DRAFT_898309 [Mycotypha africana]KAI8968001.1 hypothetical protein BDF20DRAFT_898309 [Mycotypha africana]
MRKFLPQLTHLVLEADSNQLAKNDAKYRIALLYGCYIVNQNWLKISIEKGEMVPEERFEIQGDMDHGRTGAPSKARRNRELKKQNLFFGIKVGLVNDTQDLYRKYITVGRGEIGDEYDDLIVCGSTHFTDEEIAELKNTYPTKYLISHKWVDDCICNYEIIKKDSYLL